MIIGMRGTNLSTGRTEYVHMDSEHLKAEEGTHERTSNRSCLRLA